MSKKSDKIKLTSIKRKLNNNLDAINNEIFIYSVLINLALP